MKLHFLGTGAADFLPSLADVDRFRLNPDIRRSTVTLVDEEVLLDCGPHLLDELQIHQVDKSKIQHILLSHKHSDHFNPENIRALAAEVGELHLWYNEISSMDEIPNVILHPMEVGKAYTVGQMEVTALDANHIRGAVHYSIVTGGKKLFYGCDGAWLLHDTYYYMKDQRYDAMIMDATVGDYDGDFRMGEHNSIPMIRMMHRSFETWNLTKPETKMILSHLARTLHVSHADTCRRVEKDGYLVAFDGMDLTV